MTPPNYPTDERQRRVEKRIAVRRFGGPQAFVGAFEEPLRVAHLTDQHFGFVTPNRLQWAAAKRVNDEQPDLVVLTGDYVAHSLDHLDRLVDVVGSIQAPKVGVLGNHDHWNGAAEVRRALLRAGVEVLDNAHTSMDLGGRRLQVVGLDDAYTGHADAEAATRGLRAELPTLGLSHIAEEADKLWRSGANLVLSGHTHSGQITLGNLHHTTLGKWAGHRYVHGLYGCRNEDRAPGAVYVSAGIGASVFGLRVGERARPEVAIFELGHEPGSFDEHHSEQDHHEGRHVSPAQRHRRWLEAQQKSAKRARWRKLKRALR